MSPYDNTLVTSPRYNMYRDVYLKKKNYILHEQNNHWTLKVTVCSKKVAQVFISYNPTVSAYYFFVGFSPF